MGERILGIDLTDQGAGVMFSDSEQSFHVPAAICRDKKHDQWYVGEEAYEKALSGKGIITDRLVSLALKGGTATVRGVRYEGTELLVRSRLPAGKPRRTPSWCFRCTTGT